MSKKYKHFTKDERNEISILLKRGYSHREISDALGKDHSSVSREVRRNKVKGRYEPKKAHHKSLVKRARSKWHGMKITVNPELGEYIADKLKAHHWTPEQIAGRWNKERHVDSEGNDITITAKSIYKYLYSAYGNHLCKYLPSKRYKPKKRRKKRQKKQIIPNRTSIDERPERVSERKEFGHFEGDTLGRIKTDSAALVGALERISRRVFLKKVPRLKYAMDGLKETFNPHQDILESLTLDNGVENVRWEELGVPTYFCNPYSSWEKGSMENGFRRVRRFIPKKASLNDYTNQDIEIIERTMNDTPRKCLEWKTPNEVYNELSTLKVKQLYQQNNQ